MMSMASGFSAMIEAITTTNSPNFIGLWVDDTARGASALMSVTKLSLKALPPLGSSCCDAQADFRHGCVAETGGFSIYELMFRK
jgi:hypothetical protein